ncbi:MAG: T9SS type A sorting domain-containing protein [Bacteroidales bacterium]|nr:T9SS type A sorting domain-containing protein [Bacteroidales bacterium]
MKNYTKLHYFLIVLIVSSTVVFGQTFSQTADYTNVIAPQITNDLGVTGFVSPVTGYNLGMEDVSVNIFNYGTATQSNFDVSYTINGGTQVTEAVTDTINPGESCQYTFTQQADLSVYDTYLIESCTELSGDENPENDCEDTSILNYDPGGGWPYSVELWDDYGDGWNGGTLTVLVDGEVVLDNITLEAGSGPETFYFDAVSGAEVTCIFTPGGWPYECSYYIYCDGNVVFADGEGGVEPTGGTFIAICAWGSGSLTGYVTEMNYGTPIEGATVSSGDNEAITNADGEYWMGLPVGVNYLEVTATGYNPLGPVSVVIYGGCGSNQDFELTAPTMDVDPLEIYVILNQWYPSTTETITINNNGNGPLTWYAGIIYYDKKGNQPTFPPYQEVINELELNHADTKNSTGLAPTVPPNAPIYTENKFGPLSTAYAYLANDTSGNLPEGPFYFTLNDPDTLTPFGDTASDFIATADWVNDVWYGVISGGTLVSIDMDDGTLTTIGPCPDMTGMAYDWTSETMYGVDPDGTLWTIDLSTGTGTQIASTQPQLITLVCTNEGILYGFDQENDSFGMIDKTNGTWTVIAYIAFDFNYAQDACVDHETNTIYWACYDVNLGGELLTVDAATGAISFVGAFPNAAEVAGFAIPWVMETWIGIDPYSGNIEAGGSEEITVNLDAFGVATGTTLEADVHIVSDPEVGEVDVHVIMDVEVGICEMSLKGLSIFPNPAADLININSDVNISNLKVYDFTGKVVLKEKINASQTQINTTDFEAGVYLLQIFTDNGIQNRNVIIK